MEKKIIITGVTGQDGSYMADYLLESTNHEIYGMIRRSAKPDYSNLKKAMENPRFTPILGDLSDSQSIENIVREIKPDYLINFAAQSFVKASWEIPEQTFEVAAMGVLRCLESIRKHAPLCRFYSAGSSEEMGDVIYSPQDLNHPVRPRSPYGAGKAAARHLTKVYRDSYGIYAVHCILYNHESERRGEDFVTRKITKNVARIKYAIDHDLPFQPLELGNLDSKRDWSHAKDFIKGIWLMMNRNKPKEYILSSNETHSIREFIEKAFSSAGIEGAWRNVGKGPFKPEDEVFMLNTNVAIVDSDDKNILVKINPKFYRPAEVDLLWGDSTPARTELGWKPEISFDKLVELMVSSDIYEYRRTQEAAKIK